MTPLAPARQSHSNSHSDATQTKLFEWLSGYGGVSEAPSKGRHSNTLGGVWGV
jgi:hypothetical protein